MGNTYSTSTRRTLATAAIAKYMNLTKPQVMAFRNALVPMANVETGTVKRDYLEFSLKQANIEEEPDCEILRHLFTMWDEEGRNMIPCAEFIVSIAILACKDDGIEQAFRFALTVADRNKTGVISSRDALTFLKSICATASYFGDELLSETQIYKVVDNVFDTMALISQDDEDLSHDQFVALLSQEKHINDLILTEKKKKYNSSASENNVSSATNSSESNSIAGTASADSFEVPIPRRKSKSQKYSQKDYSGKKGNWATRNILSLTQPKSADTEENSKEVDTMAEMRKEHADTTKSLLSSGSEQPQAQPTKKQLRSALKKPTHDATKPRSRWNKGKTAEKTITFSDKESTGSEGYIDEYNYYSDYTSNMSYKLTPVARIDVTPE